MLQNHYLFKLLCAVALLLCADTRCIALVKREGLSQERLRLQRIYLSQIGVREGSGLNDGAEVEDYLKYTGLKKGNPWCAAFVCWCLGQAGLANPRSGWSPHLFSENTIIWRRERRLNGTLKAAKQRKPQAGDVFGIFFAEKKRIAHCGFIDSWTAKWVVTTEGNTNEGGRREGDGVYRKRRLIKEVYCVAMYAGR